MTEINIYTDGSSRGNPGPGGYGTILQWGPHQKELSGGYRLTTNNRMELMAVIVGLQALTRTDLPINIVSDSKYVVDAVEKKWVYGWVKKNFKDKANEDLWRKYLALSHGKKVRFTWIRGHNGHEFNERCDQLAVAAATGGNLLIDEGYGK